jgi:uncharacterized protein YbbC (DUF1343 family)
LPLLNNKQIGIVTNQTGILSNKTHLALFRKNIAVQKIFAPEHGFRTADAGEHIVDGKILKLDFQLFRFMATIKNQNQSNSQVLTLWF